MSSNLRRKSYVFRNQQLSPEDYKRALHEINFGSAKTSEELKNEFQKLQCSSIHRFAHIIKSENSSGNNIKNSKNAFHSFDITDSENVRYFYQGLLVKDSMDLYGAGDHGELIYEGVNVAFQDSYLLFSSNTYEGMLDARYCDYCRGSQYVFGCVGIRKGEYCILNKQYTKEEYLELIPKIIDHMNSMPYVDERGIIYRYGEFWPFDLSPFAYNETLVQEHLPISVNEAREKGYVWQEQETREYKITKNEGDLPDGIHETRNDILKEVIQCRHNGTCKEQCTTAFKIIPEEFAFYRKYNIPLPRLCPNCRHYARLAQRNPYHLWHRKCMCDYSVYQNSAKHLHHPEGKCPNEFETSYAPDRPEIVYCEQCYNAEVA